MGKRKKPHSEDSGSEAEVERQTQEKAELVAAEPFHRVCRIAASHGKT